MNYWARHRASPGSAVTGDGARSSQVSALKQLVCHHQRVGYVTITCRDKEWLSQRLDRQWCADDTEVQYK